MTSRLLVLRRRCASNCVSLTRILAPIAGCALDQVRDHLAGQDAGAHILDGDAAGIARRRVEHRHLADRCALLHHRQARRLAAVRALDDIDGAFEQQQHPVADLTLLDHGLACTRAQRRHQQAQRVGLLRRQVFEQGRRLAPVGTQARQVIADTLELQSGALEMRPQLQLVLRRQAQRRLAHPLGDVRHHGVGGGGQARTPPAASALGAGRCGDEVALRHQPLAGAGRPASPWHGRAPARRFCPVHRTAG